MGYRASWVAVKDVSLPTMLEVIGANDTGETIESADDPGLYAMALHGGFRVVIGDGRKAMRVVKERHAKALSVGSEALFFSCDDTTMCATLVRFANGREAWRLEHDGSNGPTRPTVTGEAPALVHQVIAQCEAKQAGKRDVDHLYDAAPRIGLTLVGFRHDQTLQDGEAPVTVLDAR